MEMIRQVKSVTPTFQKTRFLYGHVWSNMLKSNISYMADEKKMKKPCNSYTNDHNATRILYSVRNHAKTLTNTIVILTLRYLYSNVLDLIRNICEMGGMIIAIIFGQKITREETWS